MEWISVKDKLPPEHLKVLFFYVLRGMNNLVIKNDIVCGHCVNGIWHVCYLFVTVPFNHRVEVIYWKELPTYPNIIYWDY
jgi:hypothetical protein